MKQNFSVKQDEDNIIHLFCNGQPCYCPDQTVLKIPMAPKSNLSHAGAIQEPTETLDFNSGCNSLCAKFRITEFLTPLAVIQKCCGNERIPVTIED